jgi:hypothetical protein
VPLAPGTNTSCGVGSGDGVGPPDGVGLLRGLADGELPVVGCAGSAESDRGTALGAAAPGGQWFMA